MAGKDAAAKGHGPAGDVNVVVVVGEVSRDATVTEAGDGRVFTSFDVVCRGADGRTVVPVTLEADNPLTAGTRVAVFGTVNKRFYASGAGLAARTDVRADRVTVVRRPAQLVRLIQGVADDLLGR
ncbi:MAG: hypothetical protein RL487_306 [Actinomycetota bacterium]